MYYNKFVNPSYCTINEQYFLKSNLLYRLMFLNIHFNISSWMSQQQTTVVELDVFYELPLT